MGRGAGTLTQALGWGCAKCLVPTSASVMFYGVLLWDLVCERARTLENAILASLFNST